MDVVDAAVSFARALVLPLATLLPLINPPGTLPIFLSMTPSAPDRLRTLLAGRIARHSLALLAGAMVAGTYILVLFGLSLAAIKIAGGLLVMTTAWHLLRSDHSFDSEIAAASPALPVAQLPDHSFYPLTFPITIGPGSLSVAVTLGAGMRAQDASEIARLLGALTGIGIVAVTIYLCYRFASRLMNALGNTGSVVLTRLSAFVLLSVGVQILCDGIAERFG
jgi:multiple antibiotic resistance protein